MTRLDENAISLAKAFLNVFGFSLILEDGDFVRPAEHMLAEKRLEEALKKKAEKSAKICCT